MNKLLLTFMTVIIIILAGSPMSVADDQVKSLRGPVPIDASSVEPLAKQWEPEQKSIERNFSQQPPLIPHNIDSYEITLQVNTCLVCHSKANFKNTGAPMAGLTHFMGSDGKILEMVSARRYFCNQCHVRQVEAEPLVKNSSYELPGR